MLSVARHGPRSVLLSQASLEGETSDSSSMSSRAQTPEPLQLPRQLSQAFSTELSPDFLRYLNLKAPSATAGGGDTADVSKPVALAQWQRRRSSAIHAAKCSLLDSVSRGMCTYGEKKKGGGAGVEVYVVCCVL